MNRFTTFAAATLAAAGIVFAPAPASAADSQDIAKILAGIAVAGIVAKAIDNRRDDRKEAERAATATATEFGRFGTSRDRYEDDRRSIEGTIRPYRREEHRDGPKFGKGYKKQPLPEQCLVRVDTGRGERLAYGAHCLDRSYRFADKLPGSCETVVRTPRGLRTVYGARCLEREGWRVAGW